MLTPDEIEAREFLVSLRGYDRDEVHAFLGEVAETVRGMRAGAPAAASGEPSDMFAHIAQETQRILEAAQEAGAQIKQKAKQEADKEIKDARARAAKLIADGERRRERLEKELVDLEAARDGLAVQLRGVGRTLEQTLRDLTSSEAAPSVREALSADDDGSQDAGGTSREHADGQAVDETGAGVEPGIAVEPEATLEEPEARADVSTSESTPAEPAAEPAEPAVEGAEAAVEPTEADSEAQRLRNQALSPLHPKLVRKVKRGLQDMQNAALDRLRRAGGGGEPGDFVPTEEEVRIVGLMATEFLDEAYTAGVGAASELAGRELSEPSEPRNLEGDFVTDVTERIRTPLSATLRMGMSSGQAANGLNDRMGAVFSELKGAVAEEVAAAHLVRAYESGLLDTWAAGGISHRRWILGREPRCPEARCRHNDQIGPVAMADDFPSGHRHPPVHAGCNCTTVPVLEGAPDAS